jgi:hypothetical protein
MRYPLFTFQRQTAFRYLEFTPRKGTPAMSDTRVTLAARLNAAIAENERLYVAPPKVVSREDQKAAEWAADTVPRALTDTDLDHVRQWQDGKEVDAMGLGVTRDDDPAWLTITRSCADIMADPHGPIFTLIRRRTHVVLLRNLTFEEVKFATVAEALKALVVSLREDATGRPKVRWAGARGTRPRPVEA